MLFLQQGLFRKEEEKENSGKTKASKEVMRRLLSSIQLLLHDDECSEIMGNDVFFGTFFYAILILCEPWCNGLILCLIVSIKLQEYVLAAIFPDQLAV